MVVVNSCNGERLNVAELSARATEQVEEINAAEDADEDARGHVDGREQVSAEAIGDEQDDGAAQDCGRKKQDVICTDESPGDVRRDEAEKGNMTTDGDADTCEHGCENKQ